MAQTALTIAGYAVGTYFGYPQLGTIVGAYVGGQVAMSSQKFQGARLNDLKVPGFEYGSPIPRLWGRARVAAPPIWMSDKREVATTSGGKGGASPEVTTYTYEVDVLYLVADNEIDAVPRVWANGELVYTTLAASTSPSIGAGLVTTRWTDLRVYDGNGAQTADATYEAAVGVGNAPAYRGRGTVMIEGLQLGASGQLPVLTFEVCTSATSSTRYVETAANPPYAWTVVFDTAPLRWFASESTVSLGDGATYNTGMVRHEVKADTPVSGGKRYLEIYVDALGTSTATNAYWLVVEDSIGQAFGHTYDGDWTTDPALGASDGFPYPAATSWKWELSSSANVFRYALDFVNGKAWISVNGGAWNGANVSAAQDPATNTHGKAFTSNGTDLVWHLYADAAYPSLSLELRVSESQFDYAMPDGFIPWSSDGDTATVWTPADVPLPDVVEDLCVAAGLTAGQIDTTDLTGLTVVGVPMTAAAPVRSTLEALAGVYYFDCAESDKVYFPLRGTASAATIVADEMCAGEDGASDEAPVQLERGSDIEVPARYALQYINADDDYQTGTVYADREVALSGETATAQMAMVLAPARAQGLVDMMSMEGRVAATGLRLQLADTRPELEPTDVVTLTDEQGISYRARIVRDTFDGAVRALEAVLDESSVLATSGTTTAYTPGIVIGLRATTLIEILDIPILQDADDAPGHYAVLKALSGTWSGSTLYVSADGTTYTEQGTAVNQATFGTATTALTTWAGGNVFDETSTVTVDVGNGTLASSTRDLMLTTNANAAVVGSEVIQYRTATYVSPGVYTLSGLLRGRRGTEWAMTGHAAGEVFAVLASTGTLRVPVELAQIGTAVYHKPVTFGRSLASTTATSHTNASVGLEPFAPSDGRIARDTSNNATITWRRRSRLSGRFLAEGAYVALGEAVELYSVDIAATGAPATVLRTISASTETASYTAAQQTADGITPGAAFIATVYQISSTVGRGYGLEINA